MPLPKQLLALGGPRHSVRFYPCGILSIFELGLLTSALDLCTAGTVVLLTEACLKPLGYLRFDIDEIHSAWALCCGTLGRLVEQDHPVEPVLDGLCNIFQKLATGKLFPCVMSNRY
jgi:hypothetical protein